MKSPTTNLVDDLWSSDKFGEFLVASFACREKPRSVPRISEAYSETDEQENEVSKSSSDNKLSLVNFIYENENSIPDVLCDNIIELYDSEENKHPGSTHGGVQKIKCGRK